MAGLSTYQLGFGERLSDLLQDRKMDQKSLAAHLDITQATVSNWITGKSEPSMKNLKQLAELFGVSIDWLVGMPPKGGGKRTASRVTGLSVEAIEALSKYSPQPNARAREKIITSGTFDLITKYCEKVKLLSLQLGTFAKLALEAKTDSKDTLQSQILTLKLALLESKETRVKFSSVISGFLDDYTNYSAIEESVETIVEKVESFMEKSEDYQEGSDSKSISIEEI